MIGFIKTVPAEGAGAKSLITETVKIEDRPSFISSPKSDKANSTLTIVVVGATGVLARNKIFPALFALFYDDQLPEVCRCDSLLQKCKANAVTYFNL